jgi:hypothetical protein
MRSAGIDSVEHLSVPKEHAGIGNCKVAGYSRPCGLQSSGRPAAPIASRMNPEKAVDRGCRPTNST